MPRPVRYPGGGAEPLGTLLLSTGSHEHERAVGQLYVELVAAGEPLWHPGQRAAVGRDAGERLPQEHYRIIPIRTGGAVRVATPFVPLARDTARDQGRGGEPFA